MNPRRQRALAAAHADLKSAMAHYTAPRAEHREREVFEEWIAYSATRNDTGPAASIRAHELARLRRLFADSPGTYHDWRTWSTRA